MKFLKYVQQMNIYHQQCIFFLQSYILMPFFAKNYHFWPKKVLLIFSARNWVKRSWYSYSTPFLGLVCKKLETVSFFFFFKGFWPSGYLTARQCLLSNQILFHVFHFISFYFIRHHWEFPRLSSFVFRVFF